MNNYYDHLSKTPLSVFIECLCEKNLQALVISGEVEDFVLEDAWAKLQEQYATAMGSSEHKLYLKLLKDINATLATMNQARLLIDTMQNYYHGYFGRQLSKLLAHPFRWSERRPEIDANLKRAEVLLKSIQMQLQLKQSAFEALQKKMDEAGSAEPTRAYFDTMLNLLEEHSKVPVNDTIMTSRYCDKVQRMNNHYKRLTKK